MAANLVGSNIHLSEKTFWKRRHDNNATSTTSDRSLYLKLRARVIFARSLLDLQRRRRNVDPLASITAA